MSNRHKVAIYARVSSDRQAQDGTIDSQVDAVREFATAGGLVVDADLTFVDNGVSGTTLVRPALDALRDRAAVGEIDTILIHTPDRLARKYAHQLVLMEEFHRLGVEIVFVNRAISSSPEDQLLLQIQGVISEYEREKIMERGRRGKLHKAKQGKVCALSGAPYGYVYIPATEASDARYVIHEQEAEVVRRIFALLVRDGLSAGAIARLLTEEHIPTPRDIGVWQRATVRVILKNPAYVGTAAYGKTRSVEHKRANKRTRETKAYAKHARSSNEARPRSEWISIPVPAIVDQGSFDAVQARMEENMRFSPRNNQKYEYLVSGLVRCKGCGYAMYGKPVSGSRGPLRYYRCHGLDGHMLSKGRVCSGHPVRVETIDDLVWEQIRRLMEEPEAVIREYTARLHHKQNQQSDYLAVAGKKKKEIKQQEREKERLLDLYQRGVLEVAEIEERLKAIRAKVNRLTDECSLLQRAALEDGRRLQMIEQVGEFAKRVGANLANLSFAERKQIVRLLVEEVVVDTETDQITVRHILPLGTDSPLRKGGRLAFL
jgi:site-specific DNA recombinase